MLLTSGWVSHILQVTVADLLTDPAVPRLVAATARTSTTRREALRTALGEHGIGSHGESGLTVWVPVRDESAVVDGLRTRGWWTAAGTRFRIAAPPGVRVTTAALTPAEASRLAGDFADVLAESQAVYGGQQEAGLTPMRWLIQQRVDRAGQLLEGTDLPVDRIAADAGFGTGAALRQHFHAVLGV